MTSSPVAGCAEILHSRTHRGMASGRNSTSANRRDTPRRGQLAAPDPVMGFRRSWTATMLRTSNHAPGSNGPAPRSLVQDTPQPLKTLLDSGEYLPHSPGYSTTLLCGNVIVRQFLSESD